MMPDYSQRPRTPASPSASGGSDGGSRYGDFMSRMKSAVAPSRSGGGDTPAAPQSRPRVGPDARGGGEGQRDGARANEKIDREKRRRERMRGGDGRRGEGGRDRSPWTRN